MIAPFSLPDLAIGIVVLANVVVSVQVIKCPMLSAFQKAAQCAIVWFAPIVGAVGIWSFLRSQYNWQKFDTRAYPEQTEKLVLSELDNSSHGNTGRSGSPHSD